MVQIQDLDSGKTARINESRQLTTEATTLTSFQTQARNRKAGHLSLDVSFTSDSESGVVLIRNTAQDLANVHFRDISLVALDSTGGDGSFFVTAYHTISGGTLHTTGTSATPQNAVVGDATTLPIEFNQGDGSALTVTGTKYGSQFIKDTGVTLSVFDEIIIPSGQTMALTFTPSTGNTSQRVLLNINFFFKES